MTAKTMDETTFDQIARDELAVVEEWFDDVDPDDIEITTSDGVLTLLFRNGVRVVINSHRAARQIWMAAVATAWHFDFREQDARWHDSKTGAELRDTLSGVIHEQLGLQVPG
jgi:CyaY protein